MQEDKEEFCRSKSNKIEQPGQNGGPPTERHSCEICQKMFKGQEYVIKHIKNKHIDVINEAYERDSTKEWIESQKTKNFKAEMK